MCIRDSSVADDEIKFGYAVTGTVHPARVTANAGAMPGDALVFTKRLGTGVIGTALTVSYTHLILDGSRQKPHPIRFDFERDAAGERHLPRMANQAEAGDVGAAVDGEPQHFLRRAPVQGEHLAHRFLDVVRLRQTALQCGPDHAGAEALGEDQRVARHRACVGGDLSLIHIYLDRKSVV